MQEMQALLRDAFQTDAQAARSNFWLEAVAQFGRTIAKTCIGTSDEARNRVAGLLQPFLRDSEYIVRLAVELNDAGLDTAVLDRIVDAFGLDFSDVISEFLAPH